MNLSLHYLLLLAQNNFQKRVLEKTSNIGLMPGQPKVLDFLKDHDGCEQKEIAKGCCLDPATVTGILGRMETIHLIERKQLPGNRRSLHVFLTETGRKAACDTEAIFFEIENRALKGITVEEQEDLKKTLFKIYENLNE
ncbi:MarR family winged helix-turn-helix transcriptional regulator [Anaeromicropila herbilytica]|uniref:MarR family transcriptional regulator n=1 Tax=Anaeromicropila herbilytica TaxID=2785025 RepID=A0A7R7IG00_9FIRM|nr:MarR family transcriptional regulator [Anaeromicropila herbilytica]BCN32573.1 MarR family transcriptional regulator [Anaeromicropila herbilytica]